MTQYAAQDRGSGRISQLAPWSPPTSAPIAPQAQAAITPHDFMQGMAELQTAVQANTLALAEFQRQHQAAALSPYQPAPAPYHPQSAAPLYPQAWAQPNSAPVWTPPSNNSTINPSFNPTFNINIDANSHSAQDNGGGGWWGLVFLGLFVIPIGAAMVGGR